MYVHTDATTQRRRKKGIKATSKVRDTTLAMEDDEAMMMEDFVSCQSRLSRDALSKTTSESLHRRDPSSDIPHHRP